MHTLRKIKNIQDDYVGKLEELRKIEPAGKIQDELYFMAERAKKQQYKIDFALLDIEEREIEEMPKQYKKQKA